MEEKTKADIDDEFLEEFRKLVKKYGRDFAVPPIQIVEVQVNPPEKKNEI